GGGVGISAGQTRGMAEGWSDFCALALLDTGAGDPHGCYPWAAYSSYNLNCFTFAQNYYFGGRPYPYSTDMAKNPLVFGDLVYDQDSDPHPGVPVSPLWHPGGG